MDEYSKAILDAIKIVVDRANNELARDLTVQGEIVSIVDLDTGEYRAKQNGAIITVYSRIPEEQYEIGEKVYITVPEGDFSNLKIIFGRVKRESLAEKMEASLPTRYNEASPYLDTIFNYDPSPNKNKEFAEGENPWGLIAGVNPDSLDIWEKNKKTEISWNLDGDAQVAQSLFRQYAKYHNCIEITGSFWTNLKGPHITGNYGLKIGFYIDGENPIEEYKFDFSSFNGDPFHYRVPSPQTMIIESELDHFKGLAYIKFFQEQFETDKYQIINRNDNNEIEEITIEETTHPNLFAQDINLRFVDKIEIDPNSYYLHIKTPNGSSFTTEYSGDIELIGELLYQNKNIYSESSCSCQWFERDPSITVGSENYDKKAGIGWKKLINQTSNVLTIVNSRNNLWYNKQYKLIMVYKGRNVFTKDITVYNLWGLYKEGYALESNGSILKIIDYNNENNLPLGDWYIQYPNNAYEQLSSGENSLDITNLSNYVSSVIFCAVRDGDNIITILDYTIPSFSSSEDIVVTYSGTSVFRYNASGTLAIENRENNIEFTLQPKLNWNIPSNGAIVEWLDQKGNVITGNPTSPYKFTNISTMFRYAYVDDDFILHFMVKDFYRLSYDENILTLRIKLNGAIYLFEKEFIFLKDGDQGTNGTNYVCFVRPLRNGELKYNALIYNNSWSNLQLKCSVYRDGEEITSGLSYKWEINNNNYLTLTQDTQQICTVTGKGSVGNNIPRYVKVTITIKESTSTTIKNIVFYPIDVISGSNFDITQLQTDLPLTIQYSSSGYQPLYSHDLQCIYNGNVINFSDANYNLFSINNGKLRPNASFDASNGIADVLPVSISAGITLYHTIIFFLNTYGNEAINDWDGTSLKLVDNKYILAPQIGAGKKESSTNLFTGVVMGEDTGQQKVGLYGYQKGVNTFGLTEDGIAYFGKSGKGRIVIDGDNAVIYGGNGDINDATKNGMILTLYNTNWTSSTKAISVGQVRGTPAFYVTYDGKLSATGATISGTITANQGKIGAWTIDGGAIKSTRAGTYLGADGYIYADEAYLTGGQIGGWSIGTTTLTGGATTLNSNGIISTDYFVITGYGSIGAIQSWSSGATILGIKSSSGQSVAIEASGAGNAYLRSQNGTVGIQSGSYQLYITNNGTLYGANLTYGGGISGLGGSGGTATAVFG